MLQSSAYRTWFAWLKFSGKEACLLIQKNSSHGFIFLVLAFIKRTDFNIGFLRFFQTLSSAFRSFEAAFLHLPDLQRELQAPGSALSKGLFSLQYLQVSPPGCATLLPFFLQAVQIFTCFLCSCFRCLKRFLALSLAIACASLIRLRSFISYLPAHIWWYKLLSLLQQVPAL